MERFFTDSVEFMPILLLGVQNTILVTIGSLVLSTVLGLLWALMRVSVRRKKGRPLAMKSNMRAGSFIMPPMRGGPPPKCKCGGVVRALPVFPTYPMTVPREINSHANLRARTAKSR